MCLWSTNPIHYLSAGTAKSSVRNVLFPVNVLGIRLRSQKQEAQYDAEAAVLIGSGDLSAHFLHEVAGDVKA